MKTAKHARAARGRTRKGPAAHASETALGRVMNVNGQPWIVEASGKSQRWNKATGYFTHDNGGRPFYVKIRDGVITVLSAKYDTKALDRSEYGPIYNKVVCTIPKYEKVWIGANKGKYANKHEVEAVGNSVLIHVHGTNYVYIGDRVFEFKAPETIKEFHGILGNSDVVYAFAVGAENTYLFGSTAGPIVDYIPNVVFNGDPYAFYFSVTVHMPALTMNQLLLLASEEGEYKKWGKTFIQKYSNMKHETLRIKGKLLAKRRS